MREMNDDEERADLAPEPDIARETPAPAAAPAPTGPRQRELRYTGDGTLAAAGFPANPDHPDFSAHMTDDELERLLATGLFEIREEA